MPDGSAIAAFDKGPLLIKEAPLVAKRELGGMTIGIRSEKAVESQQQEKMLDSMESAFNLEKKILGGEARKMFWPNGDVDLTLSDEMGTAAMMNNFYVDRNFATSMSKESLSAAMVHELVEMSREEKGLIGEGVPLMTEFLFCTMDRNYFQILCQNIGKSSESHQIGWNKVVGELGFETANPEKLYKTMLDWKSRLSEEDKVAFVKNNLLGWEEK